MRHLKCSSCAKEFPAGEMFLFDGAPVCEPCGDRMLAEANAKKHKPEIVRITDATICSRCKTDNGNTDLRLIGGAPFCPRCAEGLYAYPFPLWLKGSFAALVALLAFALWHGAPYFAAGRHLVQARRALDQNDYQTAATHFAGVLPVKPASHEVILLGAKANLMVGDVGSAAAFLDLRKTYPDSPLFTEVNGMWERANNALQKADSAGKLAQANRNSEAIRLMSTAVREYPEAKALAVGMQTLTAGEAYERKDYNAMLAANRAALALMPDHPRLIAGVASALACKYAVTGDSTFLTEAELLLRRAEGLAEQSAEEKVSYDEYAERIRYRLRTREIIDRDEYDRRFRSKPGASK